MAKHRVGLLSSEEVWPAPFLLSAVMAKLVPPNTSLGSSSGPAGERRGSSLFKRKLNWQEGQG